MSYKGHTKIKMSDILKSCNSLNLGLTRHWRCCLSATLILLKSTTQLGTSILIFQSILLKIFGTLFGTLFGGDLYK